MSKRCQVSGKKSITGYNVSHSKVHTKRKFKPNLQKRRLLNPATGKMATVKLSAHALKTLQKWDLEGKKYDLLKFAKNFS